MLISKMMTEWVTPGGTAIPGMTSLKDGDLQHLSPFSQSSKGDIEPNHPSEINPGATITSRADREVIVAPDGMCNTG